MRQNTIIIFLAALGLSTSVATAHDTSYYAASSRLASGKWVKLKVSHTGIQQIDDATLRAAGFNNPKKVAVYGYGGAMLLDDRFSTALPDDLPRQMSVHKAGKLLFYGQAAENIELSGMTVNLSCSPYSFYGYYFLTDTREDEGTIKEIAFQRAEETSDTHIAAFTINREKQSYNYLGERWFDNMLDEHSPLSYRFPITDAAEGTMRLGYAWASEENESIRIAMAPQVKVISASGQGISNPSPMVRRTGYTDFTLDGSADIDTLVADITLRQPRPANSFVAMDHVALSYTRRNTLGSDAQRLMFVNASSDGVNMRFTELPADAQIWDVTSATDIRPYIIGDSEITPLSTSSRIILFDPNATQYIPEIVEADMKPQNLHASPVPHMLIVTVAQLREQAEQLAALHRAEQGIDVLVADADEIYNEFSSGGFSAMGVRRFVKMLYDRDPQKLRSLLIYGAASYDMRHITHAMPILPVRECSNETYMYSASQSYCTDSYFAMVADNYNPNTIWHQYPLLAVGRIPAHTPEQAAIVNDKIRRFMITPHWQRAANRSIFIADNVDNGQYHASLDLVTQNIAKRNGDVTIKDYIDFFPNDYKQPVPQLNADISRRIHDGVGFVHYVGHSSYEGFVTGDYGITSKEAHNYTNETLPVMILSTCNLGHFDGPRSTLGVSTLLASNASIANIAYSRESWARGNENAHDIIGRHLAEAKNGMTLGELWLNIRTECVRFHMSSTRYSINDINRNLLGDPELPLRFPEWNVKLSLAENPTTELKPLSPIKISGEICDTLGNLVTDFNGKATIEVMLEGIPKTTRGIRDSNAKGMTYICGSVPVAKIATEVTGGKYDATIIIPRQNDGNDIRFIVYAETDDMTHAAIGELEGLTLTAPGDDIVPDTSAPDITDFYAGTLENYNIVTRPTDLLSATIAPDPSGIAIGTMPLETAIRLSIDGKIVENAAARCIPNPDGSVTMEIPVGPLADGRHSATLSISDNAANRTESTISFEVVSDEVSASLRCITAVARDNARFEWEHTYISTDPEMNIIITDRRGTTVANAKVDSAEGQWEWNMRDIKGKPVDNGTYSASILATDGIRYTSSPAVTFTVLR